MANAHYTAKQFIEAIPGSGGIVSTIARRVGCNWYTAKKYIDNYPTVVKNRRSRRGFVGKRRDGALVWGEDYVPVLRDQYVEFRQALMREPFA